MTDSEKLLNLAKWFDLEDKRTGLDSAINNNEVQQDLRSIADELERLKVWKSESTHELLKVGEALGVQSTEIESLKEERDHSAGLAFGMQKEIRRLQEENERLKAFVKRISMTSTAWTPEASKEIEQLLK